MFQGVICPRCGQGALSPQIVTETIVVSNNAVQVTVQADVCSFCSEHWFDPQATAKIDAVIKSLHDGNVAHLKHLGELYQAS
jgi:YgiT-type zinc finger domain-containing protein